MAPPPKQEIVIFVTGLVAAVIAGVVAYRIVGLYGDGAFASGYHRIRDPKTGESLLVHEGRTSAGVIQAVIEGGTAKELGFDVDENNVARTRVQLRGNEIARVDRDTDGDGRIDRWEYYDPSQKLVKVGFSLAGDGVLNAWAYQDDAGEITKVEVSTRLDDAIDRWEYYEHGQLARVEEDTDHDGRVDRWSTYEEGILVRTELDADKDGRPDPAPRRQD